MSDIQRTAALLIACVVITPVLGCAVGPRVEPIHTDHAAAAHAVHNRHIASLMRSLSRSHARVRSHRLPLILGRRHDYRAIAKCAGDIGERSHELRPFAGQEGFAEPDRVLFETYADLLSNRSADLREAAEDRDDAATRRAFARLTATCNACHYTFREQIQEHHEREHGGGSSGE